MEENKPTITIIIIVFLVSCFLCFGGGEVLGSLSHLYLSWYLIDTSVEMLDDSVKELKTSFSDTSTPTQTPTATLTPTATATPQKMVLIASKQETCPSWTSMGGRSCELEDWMITLPPGMEQSIILLGFKEAKIQILNGGNGLTIKSVNGVSSIKNQDGHAINSGGGCKIGNGTHLIYVTKDENAFIILENQDETIAKIIVTMAKIKE